MSNEIFAPKTYAPTENDQEKFLTTCKNETKKNTVQVEDFQYKCEKLFSEELQYTNDREMWDGICSNYDKKKKLVEEYMRKKRNEPEISLNPFVQFMEDNVFPVFLDGMKLMLKKAIEEDSCYEPKTTFDGIDFLCEYLYNEDPHHPERKENPVSFLELDWVKQILKEKPRPFYPKHRLWSGEYAAKIIQSVMRGHWVRCRPEVQELRQFWRNLENEENPTTVIVNTFNKRSQDTLTDTKI